MQLQQLVYLQLWIHYMNQRTRIQLRTIIEKIQKLEPVAIGIVIIAAGLNIVESVNNLVQFPESICRANPSLPWCLSGKLTPQWIGTKIEDVYIKKLQNYEPETTLVVTDKFPAQTEDKDISILRNVDQQELSKIGIKQKTNSGQYEAILRRYKKNGIPLCLKIYGKRNFATSEFKNIIIISDFPDSKTYDSLKSEERDKKCTDKYEPPIVPK
jgi:hypothetical protein